MQGERIVGLPIVFGPYHTRPNGALQSAAVSGVIVQVFPGSGSVDNTGPVIYEAGTGEDGRAAINFRENVIPNIGWVAKVIYPVGAFDSALPNYQLIFLEELRL